MTIIPDIIGMSRATPCRRYCNCNCNCHYCCTLVEWMRTQYVCGGVVCAPSGLCPCLSLSLSLSVPVPPLFGTSAWMNGTDGCVCFVARRCSPCRFVTSVTPTVLRGAGAGRCRRRRRSCLALSLLLRLRLSCLTPPSTVVVIVTHVLYVLSTGLWKYLSLVPVCGGDMS